MAGTDNPLASARLKFIRAGEHLQDFYREVRRFENSHPYRVVREVDSETGEHLTYAVLERNPDDELSLVLGDVIHNLRASLDHAVTGLSAHYLARPMTDAEFRSTEYPIYRNRDDFILRGGHRAIRFLPEPITDLIEREQPYNVPPDEVSPLDHPLATLQDLWNADKHRTLLATAAFAKLWGQAIPPPDISTHRFTEPIVENGSAVSRFAPGLPPHTQEQFDTYIGVEITLKESGPAWGEGIATFPVNWLVNGLYLYIDRLLEDMETAHDALRRGKAN